MSTTYTPIKQKLMRVILMTCGVVLILTCAAFFVYEFFSFRDTTRQQIFTLGEIVATNSTAALAFDNQEDANEILNALKAEKQIVAACLYDMQGHIFSSYPGGVSPDIFPVHPESDGYRFEQAHLLGFQPVEEGNKRLGTLFIKSDMKLMYERFRRYGLIVFLVVFISGVIAYFLSIRLQKSISKPIFELAEIAGSISEHHDYSVRAPKSGVSELVQLTNAFNHMLAQIEAQTAEITSLNQNLEQKVKERTLQLELAKSEIENINEKLLKSNHDLEQFAYIASHDLQEPLRKIQTFSELADKSLDTEAPSKKYIEKINAAARRMADLIKDVLNFSRVSEPGAHFSETDLNDILENIKIDFELLISEKNATITSGKLPIVNGIPMQLNQLFLNLVNNSLKFSKNQPAIDISSRILLKEELNQELGLSASDKYIELIFKDNGIGFEQQYADKIFTIFQRLHNKTDYAGTGIGLAMCKKIVQNHQGAIHVESELGNGARFYVYLPMA